MFLNLKAAPTILGIISALASCAHKGSNAPVWADGVRAGTERLKVMNGSTALYRRIASNCDRAVAKAEDDIYREYNQRVSYTLEVAYFDQAHEDCAVTLAVGPNAKALPAPVEGPRTQLQVRSDLAKNNAFNGLGQREFFGYIKERPRFPNYSNKSACWMNMGKAGHTIHGTTHVCWNDDVIVGFCDLKLKECFSKNP